MNKIYNKWVAQNTSDVSKYTEYTEMNHFLVYI